MSREVWKPTDTERAEHDARHVKALADHARRMAEPEGYAAMVRELECQGLTTSDAQGCADAHFRKLEKST